MHPQRVGKTGSVDNRLQLVSSDDDNRQVYGGHHAAEQSGDDVEDKRRYPCGSIEREETRDNAEQSQGCAGDGGQCGLTTEGVRGRLLHDRMHDEKPGQHAADHIIQIGREAQQGYDRRVENVSGLWRRTYAIVPRAGVILAERSVNSLSASWYQLPS